MTATVMEDAVVTFWSREDLESLLQRQPKYYRELVDILEESTSYDKKISAAHSVWDRASVVH
jgi:hypothetical protein